MQTEEMLRAELVFMGTGISAIHPQTNDVSSRQAGGAMQAACGFSLRHRWLPFRSIPKERSHLKKFAWFTLVALAGSGLTAQVQPANVIEVQVDEQGFLGFDGKSIAGAQISSVTGATLVVERFSRTGTFGPSARYWVHGTTGEAIKISAPGYDDTLVGTAKQTFLDVQLHKSGTPPTVVSQRYWYGPGALSTNAATAAQLGSDASNVFFASTLNTTGQIVIGRMDQAPTTLSDTSPTGASIAAGNKLYLAWAGSGSHPYLNVMSSTDGVHWVNKHTLSETSNLRPAIAAYADGKIALSWTGTNGQVNVEFSSDDGATWAGKQTLPDIAASSPAAYAINQTLYLSWRNPSTRTITLAAWNGASWSKLLTPATSENAPSLSLLNGALNVCFSGTDANHSINTIIWNTETMQMAKATTFGLGSDRTPMVIDYRWPDSTNSQALPLFLYSQGLNNVAARYWSQLAPPAFVESSATARPKYIVASIIYAPPGKSTIQYATQNQLSSSISLASTFTQGTKVTAGASFNLTGLTGGVAGASGGISTTAGTSSTTTNQVMDESRLGLTTTITFPGSQSPAIDHDQDLIAIWVNPAVEMDSLTEGGIQWEFQTGSTAIIDYVPVGWLKNPAIAQTNSSAVTMFDDLAQHGVTAQDFPKILALDPFAYNPNATPDPNRFQPTHWALTYQPANDPGGPSIQSGEQAMTFQSSTVTQSAEQTSSVQMQIDGGVNLGIFKLAVSDTNTFSWTNKVTETSGNSTQYTTNVSIVGPPYGYTGPIHLTAWWDGFFGSYVFTPDEDPNESTGASGVSTALTALAANVKGFLTNAAVYQRVTLVDKNGTVYTSFTDANGQFYFLHVPFGPAEVTYGKGHQSLEVGTGPNILTLSL
jgi:hypothetical protein